MRDGAPCLHSEVLGPAPLRPNVGHDMATVHIFAVRDRFSSLEAIRKFVDPTYSEDGDCIDSSFMREVGFQTFEPMCIEVVHSGTAKSLAELLDGASYCEQWLSSLTASFEADSAVCVFSPNVLVHPERSSLRYCGSCSFNH